MYKLRKSRKHINTNMDVRVDHMIGFLIGKTAVKFLSSYKLKALIYLKKFLNQEWIWI